MSSSGKNVTIADIAKAANVSKTTVSRYINGQYHLMSEHTRSRLQGIIEMSNYRPNYAARSLRSKQTDLIGVVLADFSTPFSSALASGISEVVEQAGYLAVFVDCSNDMAKEELYTHDLVERGVAGLVVNTCRSDNPFLVELDNRNIPIVLCDRYVNGHTFDSVVVETESPIRNMVAHLYENGYRLPYLFTQELSVSSTRIRRHDAFLEAIESIYDVTDPIANVRNVDTTNHARTAKYVEEILRESDGVPAVIGVNTMTTIHMIDVLSRMGLQIPTQMGLCGVNDWGLESQFKFDWPLFVSPGITTFNVPSRELGREAARLLLRRLQDPKQRKEIIELPCMQINRESTAPVH